MSDLIRLRDQIRAGEWTLEDLARVSGINSRRLAVLLSGRDEFKASEMMSLSDVLHLTGEESGRIFF